jgi:predicted Zn-dependent protease
MLRAMLVASAVVVCAWFALGVRQAIDLTQATALLSNGNRIAPRAAAQVRSRLDAARLLNPDRNVEILRAQLYDELGERRRASGLMREVVAAEPLNVQAWGWLAKSAVDPHTLGLALKKITELIPPIHASG